MECLNLNGVQFYEGDIIEENQCETCLCTNKKKVCSNTCEVNENISQLVVDEVSKGYGIIEENQDSEEESCLNKQYLSHEDDCSKFYHCQHGSPVLKTCKTGTFFNSKMNVCDWPINVRKVRTDCQPLISITNTPQEEPTNIIGSYEDEETEAAVDIQIIKTSASPPLPCDPNK